MKILEHAPSFKKKEAVVSTRLAEQSTQPEHTPAQSRHLHLGVHRLKEWSYKEPRIQMPQQLPHVARTNVPQINITRATSGQLMLRFSTSPLVSYKDCKL